MKISRTLLSAALLCLAFHAGAFDLKDLVKGAQDAASGNTNTQTESQASSILGGLTQGAQSSQASQSSQSSGSSTIGNIFNTVSSIIGNNDVDMKTLEGNWQYVAPAVTFQSDDLLKRAGGAGASAMLVQKMEPYYEKAGLNTLTMQFAADSTFTAQARSMTAQGSISHLEGNNYSFNFKLLGTIPSGAIHTIIEKKGTNITVTFDASKLITVVSKIASLSNNATLKSVSSLLESYDGVNIGFELRKMK